MPRTAKVKSTKNAGDGESVGGYFKAILLKNPTLLKSRSNDELLQQWLDDHPGEKEVPTRIKGILSNAKSVLRKKLRKGRRKKKQEEQPTVAVGLEAVAIPVVNPLEGLEEQIDECLTVARSLDQKQLAGVISLLRRARNEVVWKLGE